MSVQEAQAVCELGAGDDELVIQRNILVDTRANRAAGIQESLRHFSILIHHVLLENDESSLVVDTQAEHLDSEQITHIPQEMFVFVEGDDADYTFLEDMMKNEYLLADISARMKQNGIGAPWCNVDALKSIKPIVRNVHTSDICTSFCGLPPMIYGRLVICSKYMTDLAHAPNIFNYGDDRERFGYWPGTSGVLLRDAPNLTSLSGIPSHLDVLHLAHVPKLVVDVDKLQLIQIKLLRLVYSSIDVEMTRRLSMFDLMWLSKSWSFYYNSTAQNLHSMCAELNGLNDIANERGRRYALLAAPKIINEYNCRESFEEPFV